MSIEWTPVFVLPNVQLHDAIQCGIAALAHAEDERVLDLKRAQPMFCRFLGRFSDNFGEKFQPAVLLLRAGAAPNFREVAALASFRDLIAISVIAYNRALCISHSLNLRPVFGEIFAIYPWMLDEPYEGLIGKTPALMGNHDVEKLYGQSSPSIIRLPVAAADIDEPLLRALMSRWQQHYENTEAERCDRQLFRSLNMAYNASLLPAGTDTTFYDVGRLISLWVSAFEILVHPGGNGQANRDRVFDLLESTSWQLAKAAKQIHDTGGRVQVKRSLASWLYQALYDLRNDFLHGNPVDREGLLLESSNHSIFEYAAPLYRLALTAFLPLREPAVPSGSDDEMLRKWIAEGMDFNDPQCIAEKAILTAKQVSEARTSLPTRSARRRGGC